MANLTSNNIAVAKLYTALFNRAPDADGFAFWLKALDNGAALGSLVQAMLGAPEALAIYPATQTNAQFVTSFYTSVFGRAPDPDGLAFWSAALVTDGGASSAAARALLIQQITDLVSTPLTSQPTGMSNAAYAQTVADRAIFANKNEFGVYFAAELKSNDVKLAKATFALVDSTPTSMVAATKLSLGIVDTSPAPAPEPGMLITVADSAPDIASKFAAYAYSSAMVNATGMDAAQLNAVAAVVTKILSSGITGTFSLDATKSEVQLAALLGDKTALAANVSVNASNMNTAQIVAVGIGAAKVDSLSNLPAISFAAASITDAVTAGLFALAGPGSLQLQDVGSASPGELNLIAANLNKILGISGAITLNAQTSLATLTALLTASAAGTLGATTFAVNIGGMSADQVALVTGKVAGVASVTIDNTASASNIATVLAAPGMATPNVQVDPRLMSAAQVAAVGLGGVNVDAFLVEVPVLTPGDVAMTDAATSAMLTLIERLAVGTYPDSKTANVVATDASAVELSALATNSRLIKDNGITGDLRLGSGLSAAQLTALLGTKTADAANVNVDFTGMDSGRFDAVIAGFTKVDTVSNLGAVLLPLDTLDDAVTTKLLALGSGVKVVATAASATEVALLADNIGKLAVDGITGILNLTNALSVTQLSNLLGTQTAQATNVIVDVSNMDITKLDAVRAGIAKVDLVNNLSLDLGALDDGVSLTWLGKLGTGTIAAVTGASPAEITKVVEKAASFATGGLSGTMTLSAAQIATANGAVLGPKLAAGFTLTVLGDAADDVINLRDLTTGATVVGGAGVDTISLTGGVDKVILGTQAETRSQAILAADTNTAKIDKITNVTRPDTIQLSTAENAYGTGITFSSATVLGGAFAAYLPASTINTSIANFGDIFAALNAVIPLSASTSAVAQVAYIYFSDSGSSLKGGYLVINDQDAIFDQNDTIISLTGAVLVGDLSEVSLIRKDMFVFG